MSADRSAEQVQVVAQPAEESGHDKKLDVSAERVNSEAQTQHDPLCRNGLTDYEWANITRHVAPEDCTYCTLIAKARADEREQAAQRGCADPVVDWLAQQIRFEMAGGSGCDYSDDCPCDCFATDEMRRARRTTAAMLAADAVKRIRADEREQAAQRLEAPALHEEWCVWARPMPLPGDRCDCYHAKCIAAARGEGQ